MDSGTLEPAIDEADCIQRSLGDQNFRRSTVTRTAAAITASNAYFFPGDEERTLADFNEELEVLAICIRDKNEGQPTKTIPIPPPPQSHLRHCRQVRRLIFSVLTTLLAFIVWHGPSSSSAPRKMSTTSIALVGLALPVVNAATTRGTCWENNCVQLQGGKVRLHVDQQRLRPLSNDCTNPTVYAILQMHASGIVHQTHASAIYDIFGALRGYTTTYNIVGDGTEVACYDGQLSAETVLSWCYIAKGNDDFGRADAQATACTLEHNNNERLVRDGFWIVLDVGLPNDLQWKGWYMGIVAFLFAVLGVPPLIEWYKIKYAPFFTIFKRSATMPAPNMAASSSHVAINVQPSPSGSSAAAARLTNSSLANASLDQYSSPVLPPPSYLSSQSAGAPPPYMPQRAQTMPTPAVARSVPPARPSRDRRPPPMPSPDTRPPWQT